ncbi:efflux RND transporter permease subunit [Salinithrix halophila]|uniref:Efflux RND transporter permease subunit n=1 Tax=Salinithrix halophila TaxID=1485204 RepID=A0ABV8JJT1_9BACL
MWLPKTAIRRPVFTTVAVIIILVMGFVSLTNLQTDLLPEIQPPVGAVVASYPGAGSKEVLEKVSKPLERKLGTLSGLKTIQSQSREGSALILLEFDWSQDINQVQNDVLSRINQTHLPSDVDTPNFLKFDPATFPIMQLSVKVENGSRDALQNDVDEIVHSISKLPGVASAEDSGLVGRQIRISLDGDKIKKYGLTQKDVKDRIESSNVSQPGGIVKDGDNDLTARVVSELTKVNDLKRLTVSRHPLTRQKITLDEVAEVKVADANQSVITRTNGKPGVGINVFKQSGSNTAQVASEVRDELKRLNKVLDNDTLVIFDQGKYVDRSVSNVGSTMAGGALLAMLVLFLFLRSFRSPLIIGIAIPLSVIFTFVLMYLSDFSLNIMTLGGLALGIGMLVDNAIVVIENIYRHRQMGKAPKEASVAGAGEVAAAVTASTLTTVFVFVPVIFVQGIVGQLFKEFAFTVSFSLLASLLVSLTVVPVLSAAIMKKPWKGWNRQQKENGVYRSFRNGLSWALSHRKTVLASAFLLFLIGGVGVWKVGTEFLPASDEGVFTVEVKMPSGTGLEKTKAVSKKVEEILNEEKDIANYQATIGEGENENAISGRSARNISRIYVNAVESGERSLTTRSLINRLRPRLAEAAPEAEVTLKEQSSFQTTGTPGTLEFTLSGSKEQMDRYAASVTNQLKEMDHVREVTNSREETKPELQVEVDRKKAENKGVIPAQIVEAVSNATRGETVTRIDLEKGPVLDVDLSFDPTYRQSPEKLKDLPIPAGGDGRTVSLGTVAKVKKGEGPITINRSNLQDSIEYQVQFDGTDLGRMEKATEERLAELLPAGMDVKFTGSAELFNDAVDDLLLAVGLAVLFVFLVLSAQFESFRTPFVIILTLPLMVIGVGVSLWLTKTPVGVTALIGVIVLAGIVVNNAIVLVDFINQLKDRGYSSYEAILESGTARLRPIMMTALTTILGLIPLSFGFGEGTEIQQPLAVTVIGGLLSSTLLTLFVIPVVYTLFDPELRRKRKIG